VKKQLGWLLVMAPPLLLIFIELLFTQIGDEEMEV
jgi:hypothetical protein